MLYSRDCVICRFAELHYVRLAQEVMLARCIGAWTQVYVYDNPTVQQMTAVLQDRLSALTRFSTGDHRGRWFGTYDRGADISVIWSAILISLAFRQMVLSGVGFIPRKSDAGALSGQLKKTKLDGGILKTSAALLADGSVRFSVLNYVSCQHTFRHRSGCRTANKPAPGFSAHSVPWGGHSGISVLQMSTKASGAFIDELNETIISLTRYHFDISTEDYAYVGAQEVRGAAARMHENTASIPAPSRSLHNKLPFLQPGTMLLDHMSARLISQLQHALGVNAYGALLHPSLEFASVRFNVLRDRASKIREIARAEHAEPMPTSIYRDLARLCRCDVYMALSEDIGLLRNVMCARLHFSADDDDAMDCDSTEETQGPKRHRPNSEQAEKRRGTLSEAPARRQCLPECECNGASGGFCDMLQNCFAGMHGTKHCVENAFNAVRKLKAACSTKTRGAAEVTMPSTHLAVHTNSVSQEGERRSVPIKVDLLDWESDANVRRADISQRFRCHFEARTEEGCPTLYKAARSAFGMTPPEKNGDRHLHNFTTIPPNKGLAVASVEAFVTTVPRFLWPKAWKQKLIPPGTLLFSSVQNAFRVVLESYGAHLVLSWPAAVNAEPGIGATIVSFAVDINRCSAPEDLLHFVTVESNQARAGMAHGADEFEWFAVRTDPVVPGFTPTVLVGGPLTFAVPRKKLPVATESGALVGAGDNVVALQPTPRTHCENAWLPNLMDTVPLLEWIVEEGMPGATQSDIQHMACELALEKAIAEDNNEVSETHSAAKARILEEFRKYNSFHLFGKVLEFTCPHFGSSERKDAFAR